MSNITTRIEPLGKANFDTWKLQIEALLIKNDTWNYVCGKSKCPKLISGGEESQKEVAAWEEADRKARSDLILSINPSELKQVKNCITSNDVWVKLHSIYQSKIPARKATLLKKLILCKLQDGMDVVTHLADFFDAVDKLADMEIQINDDLLSVMLLYSLPDSFENFRCAIESRDELPNPEALKVKIVEECDARKSRGGDTTKALLVSKNDKGENARRKEVIYQRKRYFPFKCHRCRKVGHKASECRSNLNKKTESTRVCVEQSSEKKEEFAFVQSIYSSGDNWCLDSGCTSHMAALADNFKSLAKITKPLNLANGESVQIKGVGEINVCMNNGEKINQVKLTDVMYVPDLRTNLMSVSKITNKGYTVIFSEANAKIMTEDGKTVAIADRYGDLYFLRKEKDNVYFMQNTHSVSEIMKWHEKLGHINMTSLMFMIKNDKAMGMNVKGNEVIHTCETCIQAKQTRLPFPKTEPVRSKDLLEIIHSDVCGPMRHSSIGGARYYVTFIDDKSRWCEVYFLKHKSEVLKAFTEYKSLVEKQTGKKIKCLQSDNGSEYCNNSFDKFLAQNGIKRRLTAPYTPQQNGLAERKNRTLMEITRCVMIKANLPPMFWAEAVNTSNYIRNRCSSRSLKGQTPYEIWKGKKPNIKHLQVFGARAYALKKNPQRGKLETRSVECIFLGYAKESKAYRLWSIEEKRVIISRDVKFLDNFSRNAKYEEFIDEEAYHRNQDSEKNDVSANLEIILNNKSNQKKESVTHEVEITPKSIEPRYRRGRPRILRTGKKGRPKKIRHLSRPEAESSPSCEKENSDLEYESANLVIANPESLKEALSCNEATEWRKAINEELLAHVKNKTWKIENRPNDRNVIGNRFVFTTKFKDGLIERRKARLVAKGCAQKKGIDYEETYSPVVRLKSIRMIMALAVENEWVVHQMDVTTAYLNGDLTEVIYMELPELLQENLQEILKKSTYRNVHETAASWLTELKENGPKVCLIRKALYGLKQAGRQWYQKLSKELEQLGMKKLDSDPCIFSLNRGEHYLVIAVYVDDLLLASKDESLINEMKQHLKKCFEMRDLGKIQHCLGIEFHQSEDRKQIKMHQSKYAKQILERFRMEECKSISTPVEVNANNLFNTLNEPNVKMNDYYPYQNLIGCLMYLATSTRPDLSFTVSMLSQFNNCFKAKHWAAAKRTLRYLKGTINYGLVFRKTGKKLVGYVDADWGASMVDRKSYTGFSFILAGTSISWESKKQQTVALSSTEAEYMALTEATKESIHLQELMSNFGYPIECVSIFNDNQGAQRLAQNPMFHNRTKHIDIRHHFIRDAIANGKIKLLYQPTQEMPADILTKGVPRVKHAACIKKLGITKILE